MEKNLELGEENQNKYLYLIPETIREEQETVASKTKTTEKEHKTIRREPDTIEREPEAPKPRELKKFGDTK